MAVLGVALPSIRESAHHLQVVALVVPVRIDSVQRVPQFRIALFLVADHPNAGQGAQAFLRLQKGQDVPFQLNLRSKPEFLVLSDLRGHRTALAAGFKSRMRHSGSGEFKTGDRSAFLFRRLVPVWPVMPRGEVFTGYERFRVLCEIVGQPLCRSFLREEILCLRVKGGPC